MSENRYISYDSELGFAAKRILVFAPHPDDEVFGCGGALALAVKAKASVRVIVVTDGALGKLNPGEELSLARQREVESKDAARVIGYAEPHFWRLPDRSLRFEKSLMDRITDAVHDFLPDLVFAPAFTEVHPDHRAIAQSVLAVAEKVAISSITNESVIQAFEVAFYEVGQTLRPNCLIDVGSVYEIKRKAMKCFSSQLCERSYSRVIEALNVYRTYTLESTQTHAEAFVYIAKEELEQRSHEVWRIMSITDRSADSLVGDPRLAISVIVPSSAPESLFQVLASQTYTAIEWIPFGDRFMIPPAWRTYFPKFAKSELSDCLADVLRLASGEWLIFCSGTQGFSPHHIEDLVQGLLQAGDRRYELFGFQHGAVEFPLSESMLVHRSLLERLDVDQYKADVSWLSSPKLARALIAISEQKPFEPRPLTVEQPDLEGLVPSWIVEIRGCHIEVSSSRALCFPIPRSEADQRVADAHQRLIDLEDLLNERNQTLEGMSLELKSAQWALEHRAKEVDGLTKTVVDQAAAISNAQVQLQANRWEIEHLSTDLESVKSEAMSLFEAKQQATISADGAMRHSEELAGQVEHLKRDLATVKAEAASLFEAKQVATAQASRIERDLETAKAEAVQSDRRTEAIRLELNQAVEDNELLRSHLKAIEADQVHLNEHLQRSYAFIAHLEQDLLSLRAAINRRDEDLKSVQNDARVQFKIAQQLSTELSTIHSSRAWRWITRYRNLRRSVSGLLSISSWSNMLRTKVWARLPAPLKQYLRPYTHLMRGAFWVPNSSQNLTALQELTDERLRWLARGMMSTSVLARRSYEGRLLERVSLDMQLILYQSERWIPAWVDSLFAQELSIDGIQLIVVDHNPGDGSAKALREAIDRAQIRTGKRLRGFQLIEQSNLGFGAGHNCALRAGASPWVLVVNPDLEFEAASLRSIFALALSDDAKVASWEFRQKPYEHPKHYDPVSGLCNWSSHACVLLRRSALAAIGGWDERLFMYCEDVAMSYRLREAGYLLRYCPQAVVWHHSYGDPTIVKRAQYVGSAVGQVYLRLRYGNWQDAWATGAILGHRYLGAPREWRGELLKKGLGMFMRSIQLRNERSRYHPSVPVFFPFRGLDYELRRDGALMPLKSLASLSRPRRGQHVYDCVSIITRTYGGSDGKQRLALLQQAGACVAQQTWPNLEWVVVEDAACEASPSSSFVQDFSVAHPHLKVQYLPSLAAGRSVAGNLALESANGRWVCFLDDDDLLYADHIETLMQALYQAMSEWVSESSQQQRPVAAYARAFDVPSQVRRLDRAQCVEKDTGKKPIEMGLGLEICEEEAFMHPGHDRAFDAEILLVFNYMPIQAVLFSRTLYLERGGFDPALDHLEDWNLWVRYAQGNQFVYVPKTTSMYRTPKDPAEKAKRQALLDAAYEPVREKNHDFVNRFDGH
jgi:LmbE family N-acetylglucosaminyl deacetylase/glycosyltransferase involved in cell wall biosynthesis